MKPQSPLPPRMSWRGRAPLDGQFQWRRFCDPDGTIVSYAWDFGDGNTASGENALEYLYPAGHLCRCFDGYRQSGTDQYGPDRDQGVGEPIAIEQVFLSRREQPASSGFVPLVNRFLNKGQGNDRMAGFSACLKRPGYLTQSSSQATSYYLSFPANNNLAVRWSQPGLTYKSLRTFSATITVRPDFPS